VETRAPGSSEREHEAATRPRPGVLAFESPTQNGVEKLSILLVDDQPENLLALEAVLEDLGENLVKASSGREALRCLLNQDFAVILLDVQMPDLDGFETAALIRERQRSSYTPIIFLTAAHRNETHVSHGYSLGGVDYILKPIEPEILRSKVAVFVELARKTELVRRQSELLRSIEKREHEIQLAETRAALLSDLEQKNVELEKGRRILEEKVEELARSNADLEHFAYVASHDLTEPLRVMASFLGLLATRYRDRLDADGNEFIQFAVDGAVRMTSLINDILRFSRVGTNAAPPAPTSAGEALKTALDDLASSIGESRAAVTADEMPRVMADGSQLTQVFQNLVGNAIKFRGPAAPEIHIAAERKNDEWVFSVSDNGIGFPPEHAERIFKLFQRLHGRGEYPGNGIGLSVCKRIVERHGGRIWVDSQPGRGATFHFTLPAADDQVTLVN
jgi:two-component system, sensor histidine kinase and response regulator